MGKRSSSHSLQQLDEYIERYNKKRKKYDLIIILVIFTISVYFNLGMKIYSFAIAYLTYRLVKHILVLRKEKRSEN